MIYTQRYACLRLILMQDLKDTEEELDITILDKGNLIREILK